MPQLGESYFLSSFIGELKEEIRLMVKDDEACLSFPSNGGGWITGAID